LIHFLVLFYGLKEKKKKEKNPKQLEKEKTKKRTFGEGVGFI